MHPPLSASPAPADDPDDVDVRMAFVLEALARARSVTDLERLRRSTDAAGIAANQWTLRNDALVWTGPARDVLATAGDGVPASGRTYAALIDPAAEAGRYDAVMAPANDTGSGVAFSVTYPLRLAAGQTARTLIEDTGRWFAGPDGRPAEVFGVVRRVERGGFPRLATVAPDIDALTGAAARAPLLEALADAIAEAGRTGHPCAFMVVSIANLRTLNDACGTGAGDAVLAVTGRRLRQVARTSDAVGRLTGSSFGVVLRHCNRDQLRVVAERFLAVSRDGVETDQSMVWPHTAIGSALVPDHGGSAADVLAAAQEALLSARRSDHATAVFSPPAGGPSLRSLTAQAAAEIAAALVGSRFRLTFRPAVSAFDGLIALHETGLDLLDHDGERIPVGHLMPLAEGLGVVRLIDQQKLTLAFDMLADHPDLALLTAVSPISATDPRWQARVAAMLAERSDVAGRLTLAVPATTAAAAVEGLADALRDVGSRLALTGACAPSGCAADLVVVHPSLLVPARGDPAALEPLAALATSTRAAGRLSMAGPVETAAQAEALRDLGIDCLWGPVFGDFSPDPVAVPAWRLPQRPHGPMTSAPAGAGTPLARALAALERGREEVSRRR